MRFVYIGVIFVSVSVISACSGSEPEPTDEASRDAVYDKAIANNQYVKAMCLKWGEGAFTSRPIARCNCQIKLENTVLSSEEQKEREAFFKNILEGYDRFQGSENDLGFEPYFEENAIRYAELSNRSAIDLAKLLNPANFNVELDSKMTKECEAADKGQNNKVSKIQENANKAKQDIRSIENALNLYRLDNLKYPPSNIGLRALVEQPADTPNWKPGGYIDHLPTDPWQRDYQYLNPGVKGEIDIFTLGRDGASGGEGPDVDIGNWDL